MSVGANPFSAYGGDVIAPPPPDPFAAYGGAALSSGNSGNQPTIGPAPKTPAWGVVGQIARIPSDPIGVASDALDALANEANSYTEEGEAEHPFITHVGNLANSLRELLEGGQAAGKPMGTSEGVLNNPVIGTMAAVPGAEEMLASAQGKIGNAIEGMRAARVAKRAASAAKSVAEVNPEQFVYREAGPAPQHGTPVKVASPLDNATINRLPGGKDLSPEAITTLKQHIGGEPGKEIEVGSTAKNALLKAVEPVQRTIADTGAKVKELIENAEPFKTSISEDNFDAAGEWSKNSIEQTIDGLRANLPGGDEERLNATIDKEMESAATALDSKDPKEILDYRRKLGSQIDWNNIVRNPDSPGEVQNAARAKIYRALTGKIHEIPGTEDLDRIFQPNLELQSHLDAKLGTTLSRNPAEANAQRVSELTKGKRQLEADAYNEVIAQNRRLAGLPESELMPSVKATGSPTPVDRALDKATAKFRVSSSDQAALKRLLQPSVSEGRVYGANVDWYGALKSFNGLTPEQRAARFADPNAIRNIFRQQASKQQIVKWGSIAAAAHALNLDRSAWRLLFGE